MIDRLNQLLRELIIDRHDPRETLGLLLVELKALVGEVERLQQRVAALEQPKRPKKGA